MKVNFISSNPDRVVEIIEQINEQEAENWIDGITKTWDGFYKDDVIIPRIMDGNYTCFVPERYQYLLTEDEKENSLI